MNQQQRVFAVLGVILALGFLIGGLMGSWFGKPSSDRENTPTPAPRVSVVPMSTGGEPLVGSANPAGPPAGAVAQMSSHQPETIENFLTQYQTKYGLKLNRGPSGRVVQASGFALPSSARDSHQALELAKELTEHLGFRSEQIRVAKGGPPATDVSQVFKFQQHYKGIPVFSGYLQMTQSLTTGEIYLLSSELRDIGEPQILASVSQRTAESEIEKNYPQGSVISLLEAGQQIYQTGPGASSLVWCFSVDIQNSARIDRRLVLVSADNGEILMDRSVLVH